MNKHLNVADKHRLNPLSLIPGGAVITVVHSNGCKYNYDKVKKPMLYVKAISRRDASIIRVYMGDVLFWERKKGWLFNPSNN